MKLFNVIKIFFLCLLLGMTTITGCIVIDSDESVDNTNYSVKETFSYTVSVQEQSSFILEGINGDIEITGKEGITTAQIKGERIVKSESESDARDYINELRVEIIQNQYEVFVNTKQPKKNYGRQYIVNYEIEIPQTWIITVENINGNVRIENINRNVTVRLINGNIDLENIHGGVHTALTNGNTWGKISLPLDHVCTMSLVNGNIALNVPKNTSANFSASVVNGSIGTNQLIMSNMQSSGKYISGVLGSGQGTIKLSTVNGSIAVKGY